ncbi:MAG: hypothetical protein ABI836_06610, partial [Gemmatimonadota bacterium]
SSVLAASRGTLCASSRSAPAWHMFIKAEIIDTLSRCVDARDMGVDGRDVGGQKFQYVDKSR